MSFIVLQRFFLTFHSTSDGQLICYYTFGHTQNATLFLRMSALTEVSVFSVTRHLNKMTATQSCCCPSKLSSGLPEQQSDGMNSSTFGLALGAPSGSLKSLKFICDQHYCRDLHRLQLSLSPLFRILSVVVGALS